MISFDPKPPEEIAVRAVTLAELYGVGHGDGPKEEASLGPICLALLDQPKMDAIVASATSTAACHDR